MLVTVTQSLPEYENIIITFCEGNDFGNELKCDGLHCLHLNLLELFFFPLAVKKLSRKLKEINPDLIHTHLFWPTVITRLAAAKHIPIVTTIHAFVSQLVDYKRWYFRWFEKYTYRKRKTTIVAVAKGALEEYYSFLKLDRYSDATFLYTFTDVTKYKPALQQPVSFPQSLKLIAVGALRWQKNHAYLLRVCRQASNFQLDIYGKGPLEQQLQKFINKHQLSNVRLCGQVNNIDEIMNSYNIFVMPSFYEGFSLGVLEAMAMRIPLLLSNIPSFREQCENTAVYFNLNDIDDFIEKLQWMQQYPQEVQKMTEAAFNRVNQCFTLPVHLNGLREIYYNVLHSKY